MKKERKKWLQQFRFTSSKENVVNVVRVSIECCQKRLAQIMNEIETGMMLGTSKG